jgi:predicted MFS family arabinose efflux permease
MSVAIFVSCGAIGFALGQPMFGAVYKWEWIGRHTEVLLIPAALLLVLVARWCRPAEAAAADRASLAQRLGELRLIGRPLMRLFIVQSMVAVLNFSIFFLIHEFCQQRGYPAWLQDGGAFMLTVLGSAAMMIPIGRLADRFGRRRMHLIILSCSLVMWYVLTASPTLPMGLFALVCLLSGGFTGTANPMGVALGQRMRPELAGTISSLLMGLAWLVGATAMFWGSLLAELNPWGVAGALMMIGAVHIVALGLTLGLPRVER